MALGASKWKTIATVIVPAAYRGILTAILLALARVAGETAPLLFTAFGNRFWSQGWEQPTASLPVMIFNLRGVTVRGLASPGVGGGIGAARVDSDHQYSGADDLVARDSGAEVIGMQASPNPGLSVNVVPNGRDVVARSDAAAADRCG